MEEIANNNFYSIKVDKSKNRLYLTIIGFWNNINQVSEYLNDFRKALKLLSNGFTIISDLVKMKPPSKEVGPLHVEAQKLVINAGLSMSAEIMPESMIAKLSLDRFSNESGMEKGLFSSKEEAEQWLDSFKKK